MNNVNKELLADYISLTEKHLRGQPLSPDEKNFEASVEFAAQLVPGALEDQLLEYAVYGDSDIVEQEDILAIAAASLEQENTIYAAVQDAIQREQTALQIKLEDGSRIEILKILPEEEMVEPYFHEGKTIIIESRRIGKQIVTEFGGIFIPLEDLKIMSLSIQGNTIRFRS